MVFTPKKNQTEEQLEEGQIKVSEKPEGTLQGSNEFGDDYTMEVISDNEPGSDMFRIPNKDPNYSYRFLRDDADNMSVKTSNLLLQKGGWQICPLRHLLKLGIKEELLQPDKSYKVGRMVLAFMPMKLFLKKEAEDRRKANEAMAGVKRLVEEGDQSLIQIKDVNAIQPGRMDGGRVVFDKKAKGSVKVKEERYGSHNAVEE